ncbi:MAG: hypothetical protein ACRD0Q_02770 [Acidimicrobiales bacterium]
MEAAEVSMSRVRQGQAVSITGGKSEPYAKSSDLRIELRSDPVQLGPVRSTDKGTYTAEVTIPANTPVGKHQLVVIGPGSPEKGGGVVESRGDIEVVADPTATTLVPGDPTPVPRTSLPNTGWSGHLLLLAGFFALAGVVLVKLGGQEDWTAPVTGRGWSAPVSRLPN